LLIDEAWRAFGAKDARYKDDRAFAEDQRVTNAQLAIAKGELGVKGVNAATDAQNANTSAKNAQIRAAELELKQAREARGKTKDRASIRQADARIKIAQEKLALERRKQKGGGSNAQKAETDLALDILRDRETIIGKPQGGSGLGKNKVVGGMSYTEAYDYVYGQAVALMGSYRSKAYINSWVKARLRALGLGGGAKAAKPRGG
jgi:hypothetical protein